VSSKDQFEHAVSIARDALKALLLINAGAASVFIALTDKAEGRHDYTFAVLFFGCAAFLTVVAYIIAYLSQLNYANHCLEVEKGNSGKLELDKHNKCQALIFNFVAAVLLFSALGLGSAFLAAR
jgi:hypothetical protein